MAARAGVAVRPVTRPGPGMTVVAPGMTSVSTAAAPPASRKRCTDAIRAAASLCAALRAEPDAGPAMAFGTAASAVVLQGVERRLRLPTDAPSGAEPWAAIDDFVGREIAAGGWVAGYVGFDAGRPASAGARTGGPVVDLWVPSSVLRIDAAAGSDEPAVTVVALRSTRVLPGGETALPPLPPSTAVPLASLDADADLRAYAGTVARVIAAIGRGDLERLTVARRVALPADIDLLASFAHPPPADRCPPARSYYVTTPELEFAGHSPELLATGDLTRFTCHKLSGTAARDNDPATDAGLAATLASDPKTVLEHASSIRATRSALEALGPVATGDRTSVERPGLRHLLTPLTVSPRPGTGLGAVLRATLPSGAAPRDQGLALLAELESAPRGAWYGLVGFAGPGGRFEFAQVLRTLFRDASGVHSYVGAAITAGSTVAGEVAETRLKLADVVARRTVTG